MAKIISRAVKTAFTVQGTPVEIIRVGLSDGSHYFKAWSTDAEGNLGVDLTMDMRLDSVPSIGRVAELLADTDEPCSVDGCGASSFDDGYNGKCGPHAEADSD